MYLNNVSYSKLSTFTECRLKYKYTYYDRYVGIPKTEDALSFGSFIHQIFEEGYDSKHISELEKLAKEHKKTYRINGDYTKLTEICLKNFFKFNQKLGETLGVEINFSIELAPKVNIEGIIDRVIKGTKGGLLVIDYKTSKREKSKFSLYKDPQMMTYAYAAHKMYGVPLEQITCAHYYPRTNTFVDVKFGKAQIANHIRKITDTTWRIRKLKKHEFPPNQNEFCPWCKYQHICPLFEKDPIKFARLLEEENIKCEARDQARIKG